MSNGTNATRRTRLVDSIESLLGMDRLNWKPYAYVFPIILLYSLFVLFPIVFAIWISGTEFMTVSQFEWVGLENYIEIFTSDAFWNALWNTAIYSFTAVISILIGLGLALILNSDDVKGVTIFSSLIFLPYIFPIVVSSVLFTWLFTQFGIINSVLIDVGLIAEPLSWLSSSTLALPTVMTMVIWRHIGFNMVILYTGLQSIPPEYYDAAVVAGKSRWETFRYVTLPLLKGPIIVTVILGMIDSVRSFAPIWVMTEGGPGTASETLGVFFYREAFTFSNLGKGSAIALVMFVLTIFLSIIVFHYQEE